MKIKIPNQGTNKYPNLVLFLKFKFKSKKFIYFENKDGRTKFNKNMIKSNCGTV